MFEKEKYTRLQKILRNIQNEEFKKGKFIHIRNPNNKIKNIENFFTENKNCRFSIMPRQPLCLGNGKRNLEVGHYELILGLYGVFSEKGFDLEIKEPYRIIKGDKIPHKFVRNYFFNLNERILEIVENMSKGYYKKSVRTILDITEISVDLFKESYLRNY